MSLPSKAQLEQLAKDKFLQVMDMVGQPLSLITLPATGPPVTEWTGKASLQPVRKSTSAFIDAGTQEVREVLVAFIAFIPFDALPKQHWQVMDEKGQVYTQLTASINPAGQNSYWELRLSAPRGGTP